MSPAIPLILLTSLTIGQTTTYEYDEVGRLSSVSFPDGTRVQYGYDAAGNLTALEGPQIDRRMPVDPRDPVDPVDPIDPIDPGPTEPGGADAGCGCTTHPSSNKTNPWALLVLGLGFLLRRSARRRLLRTSIVLLWVSAAPSAWAQSYQVEDLMRPDGIDINNSGQIVGTTGWFYEAGQFNDITDCGLRAINDSADGTGSKSGGAPRFSVPARMTLGNCFSMVPLAPDPPGPGRLNLSGGEGINNLGEIVGASDAIGVNWPSDYDEHAFYASAGGEPVDIHPQGFDRSIARDINDSGLIVGAAGDFISGLTTYAPATLVPLVLISPSNGSASAVNNAGLVVGAVEELGESRAFIWDGTNLRTDLWTADDSSEASDINELGEVVGNYRQNGDVRAFIWLPQANYGLSAGAHDLHFVLRGRTGWRRSNAVSINDSGQILVVGQQSSPPRVWSTFLLTPDNVTPPAPIRSAADFRFSSYTGDPISTKTGELVMFPAPDIVVPGAPSISFSRYYASGLAATGARSTIGRNWRHSFDWSLAPASGTITVTSPSGRALNFTMEQGAWRADFDAEEYQLIERIDGFTVFDTASEQSFIFNSEGQLIQIVDRAGRTLELSYNAGALSAISGAAGALTLSYFEGHLTEVSDGQRTVRFEYMQDDLTAVLDADANATRYTYDASGRLLEERRPSGEVYLSQQYDAEGRVQSQTDGEGRFWNLQYVGDETRVFDPLERPATYRYDDQDRLIAIESVDSDVATLGYDGEGRRSGYTDHVGGQRSFTAHGPTQNVSSTTNALGGQTTYLYAQRVTPEGAARYDLSERTSPDGSKETYSRDPAGNVTSLVDPAGDIWRFEYDAMSRLTKEISPLMGETSYEYNARGLVSAIIDHDGDRTEFEYDSAGHRSRIQSADGAQILYGFDARGRLLSHTDERGREVRYEWTPDGFLTAQIADGEALRFHWDRAGFLVGVENSAGRASFEYNGVEVSKITDSLGAEVRFEQIEGGYIVTNEEGHRFEHRLDKEGRLARTIDPEGRTSSLQYDAGGRLTGLTTALGRNFAFAYDSSARLSQVTDPAGGQTAFTYDARSDIASIEVPGGLRSTYSHNALSQLTEFQDAAGGSWTRAFGPEGLLSEVRDPLQRSVRFSYDVMDRPSTITYQDGEMQTLSYDAAGNLIQRSYSDGLVLDFSVDPQGRPLQAEGLQLSYGQDGEVAESNGLLIERDAKSRITAISYASGKTVRYEYDRRGLVTKVTDWAGAETVFSYDPRGLRTRIARPNGTQASYSYDDDGRLTGIEELHDGAPLSSIALTLDARGRTLSADRALPLIATAPAQLVLSSADAAGQLDALTYDALGRVVQDGLRAYTWDLASRLTSVEEGGETTSFRYDAKGRLIEQQTDAARARFVWNYGLQLPSIAVERTQDEDRVYFVHLPNGELLYQRDARSEEPRYYHFDELGHTRYLTDPAGQITDAYAYAPFGTLVKSQETTPNVRFTYLGRAGVLRLAASPGLYHVRQRVLDSATLRFLSPDPDPGLLHPRLFHPYKYAINDPINHVDITGAAPQLRGDNPLDQPKKGTPIQNRLTVDALKYGSFIGAQYQDRADSLKVTQRLNNNFGGQFKDAIKIKDLENKARFLKGSLGLASKINSASSYYDEYKKKGSQGVSKKFLRNTLESHVSKIGKIGGGSVGGGAIALYKTHEAVTAERRETTTAVDLSLDTQQKHIHELMRLYKLGRITPERATKMLREINRAFDESREGTVQRGQSGIGLHAVKGGIEAFLKTFTAL